MQNFSPEIKHCLPLSDPDDKLPFFYNNVKTSNLGSGEESGEQGPTSGLPSKGLGGRTMTKQQQADEQFLMNYCWEHKHWNYDPPVTITQGLPVGQGPSLSSSDSQL